MQALRRRRAEWKYVKYFSNTVVYLYNIHAPRNIVIHKIIKTPSVDRKRYVTKSFATNFIT